MIAPAAITADIPNITRAAVTPRSPVLGEPFVYV